MDLLQPGEELSYVRTAHPPSKLYPVRAIEPPHMGQRLRRGHGGFTHDRMVNVLRDIARGREIRPIEMIEGASDEYSYRLKDGAHRFHASVVAGFPLIPAIIVVHY
jgi:hypothetical protein